MLHMMSTRLVAGLGLALGATLAACTIGATDASACSRWRGSCGSCCGSHYVPPPVARTFYGPPRGYGYVPPAPVYGYGYGSPPGPYYAYAAPVYGYRGASPCGRGYGYGPQGAFYGDYGYGPRGAYYGGYGYGPQGAYYGGYGDGPQGYRGGYGYESAGFWLPGR